MKKADVKTIVKTFYDKLEEGVILARKCPACGHVEYPPFLICNSCGNLDTEWVELSGKAYCNQILPPAAAFAEPEFRNRVGDYWVAAVQPENADESGTCLVNIDPARYEEYRAKLPFEVRPVIVQDVDTKIVLWEPADAEKPYVSPAEKQAAEEPKTAAAEAAPAAAGGLDEIAQTVIRCAASAYEVAESDITLATDIRQDLANQSMKMIVMLSGIEEELDVVIEIPEAGNLNTIGDFVRCVKEKLGMDPSTTVDSAAPAVAETAAASAADEELDEIAKIVIECAAEAYEVDASDITLATDIRQDLANQSMKMIVMLSGIEEKLDVVIEIPEAGNLNTIGDFVNCTKQKLGK